ncbi:hypothetical protein V9K67_21065 [Paraflavisolibacter sp. H34]|uniref:hypothetical protein n=1 Tax=Huijunlia imazamoxiresistens TaxID=3127457 RepID=UPI003017DD45
MNTEEVKFVLLKLAFYQTDEDAQGVKILHPAVGEEMHQLQEQVLSSFGLPRTDSYVKLVVFRRLPSEAELERRMQLLAEAATEYLLSSPL